MRDRIWIAGLKWLQPSQMTVAHCPLPFSPKYLFKWIPIMRTCFIDTPTRRDCVRQARRQVKLSRRTHMLTRIPSHYDATQKHYYRDDPAMQDAMAHKVSFDFKEKRIQRWLLVRRESRV